ncbi:substrate-binding domain-containing protein [Roseovarius sp. M141]|uniref:substrate-binding domain-containing protein n=1 Tax=Roseovarius sp. M141 TaxID=2583806 RepID=UPI0020CFBA15|nr:substrate-binding domain-containing protein [Roseovarius sp. M141]MCQ0090291.1 ABC transporter substrate-binding protein [Roseovarius sp. M141]
MPKAMVLTVGLFLASPLLAAADGLKLYGPGGPAPAMKEVAAKYETESGMTVEVIAGPTDKWMDEAQQNADALFSGSQNMMDDFIESYGNVLSETVDPLYLRPSTLLVRKGNPKCFDGVLSLMQEDVAIMVVDGAGQVGMWEDVVGRTRDIDNMRKFRDNIAFAAPNSGVAKQRWMENDELDAWLIWNHWQIDNPDIAEEVVIEPEFRIYRDVAVAKTSKGAENPELGAFLDYLKSDSASQIFADHGWQKAF